MPIQKSNEYTFTAYFDREEQVRASFVCVCVCTFCHVLAEQQKRSDVKHVSVYLTAALSSHDQAAYALPIS